MIYIVLRINNNVLFLFILSMLKNFIPNLHISSIYKLDLEYLKKLNIKLILLDLDNTLISYNDKLPNEELIAFKYSKSNL